MCSINCLGAIAARSPSSSARWACLPSAPLTQIRDAIVDQPERWKRLRRGLDEYDDGLQRTPRGYDPEHPFVEDLKRKNFTQSTDFTVEEACAPGFLNQFARSCKRAAPLMEFLADAVAVIRR